jgi:60 kDa SS-A/Ro ribonucleoprotein
MKLVEHLVAETTPQNEPVLGLPMVPNSAGGYTFAVDDWMRLNRFLILGSEGGTYYAKERALTLENATAIVNCAKVDALETVRRIVAVSFSGRAPKNDYAIFALALVAAHADVPGKKAAYAAMPEVCRTSTHLFQFASVSNALRGWGRGLRLAISDWYSKKSVRDLAYQVTKYQERDGWSHRDMLRLAHPKTDDVERNAVYSWAVGKTKSVEEKLPSDVLAPIYALEAAKVATDEAEILRLIRDYRLVREAIPTQYLTSANVWEALLAEMPLTAMLRNLATMTRVGLLAHGSEAVKTVVAELTDPARLKAARVHPLNLLVALKTYESGKSLRGKSEWTPLKAIVNALDQAFYLAFQAIEPTGKRWCLALDVSGSMATGSVCGVEGISPRVASVAMALITTTTEAKSHVMAFGTEYMPLKIRAGMRLEEALKLTDGLPFSGTDCALPMLHAMRQKIKVDTFVVYTDSETWAGVVHPFQALKEYRQKMGIPAKLIVVGMVSNGFTIADPSDSGMLDVVGFDTATPSVMADFARN